MNTGPEHEIENMDLDASVWLIGGAEHFNPINPSILQIPIYYITLIISLTHFKVFIKKKTSIIMGERSCQFKAMNMRSWQW